MDLIIFIDSERLDANTGRDLTHAQDPSRNERHSYSHGMLQEMWNHGIIHFPIYASHRPTRSNTTFVYALDITPQQRILLSV
jgi:hypothetical protein